MAALIRHCRRTRWVSWFGRTLSSTSHTPPAEVTPQNVKGRSVARDGPDLAHFLKKRQLGLPLAPRGTPAPHDSSSSYRVYLETYGCQMNVNDSEVVLSILASHGYGQTDEVMEADLILLNTCAIREKPENKVWARLRQLRQLCRNGSVIGVLGCMAERLRDRLLDREKLADLVVGPDAYRDLPNLLEKIKTSSEGSGAVNVALSLEETYADIVPMRRAGKVSAFLSIMRGCNNMCAFCIVPFTRGRERSRSASSILDEVRRLRDQGVKEITLLGQNVNSYSDNTGDPFAVYAPGFTSVYKPRRHGAVSFAELLDAVASVDDEIRIRFTSPHPKDFSQDVIDVFPVPSNLSLTGCGVQVVRSRDNVCKQLHVPAQSGNSAVLRRMRRGYDREAYDALIERIRHGIPSVALSTDIIVGNTLFDCAVHFRTTGGAGFCGETDAEFEDTVNLMRSVGYEQGFLFKYSEREKTHAHRHLADDVPSEIKQRRLEKATPPAFRPDADAVSVQVIEVFRDRLFEENQKEIGREHLVLVEDAARKHEGFLTGRTDTFKRVVFPRQMLPDRTSLESKGSSFPDIGDYVSVRVQSVTHGTLHAVPLTITRLKDYTGSVASHTV